MSGSRHASYTQGLAVPQTLQVDSFQKNLTMNFHSISYFHIQYFPGTLCNCGRNQGLLCDWPHPEGQCHRLDRMMKDWLFAVQTMAETIYSRNKIMLSLQT